MTSSPSPTVYSAQPLSRELSLELASSKHSSERLRPHFTTEIEADQLLQVDPPFIRSVLTWCFPRCLGCQIVSNILVNGRCNAELSSTGRKNLLMMGFSGYIIFGLIVGLSYEKITKVLPAFIIMYGMSSHSLYR